MKNDNFTIEKFISNGLTNAEKRNIIGCGPGNTNTTGGGLIEFDEDGNIILPNGNIKPPDQPITEPIIFIP